MARSTSDTKATDQPAPPKGQELVVVRNAETGETEEVPLDAAIALESNRTGWARDDKAKIAQLEAQIAELEAERDELKSAAAADAKSSRSRSTEAKASDTSQEG